MLSRRGLVVLAVVCVLVLGGLFWAAGRSGSDLLGGGRPAAQPEADDVLRVSTDPVPAAPTGLVAPVTGAYFHDISDEVGLDFKHQVGPLGTYFMPEVNGSGGALFDYDQDGDLDIYLVNAGRSPKAPGDFPEGTRVKNRLFRQNADHTFTDVTAESGLGDQGYGIGCAVADIDNDGDLDVYVTNYGPDRLYLNQGNGTFLDRSEALGFDDDAWGTCAAFLDYDRDGRLDLFVVNYTADAQHGHSIACGLGYDRISYCSPKKFATTIDRLFHNETETVNGETQVRFREVTESAGIAAGPTYGFGVLCTDLDRDGWTDVFVASDMTANRLWINQRDGTFRDEAEVRGVAVSGYGLAQGCMGAALGDPDNDGQFDMAVTNLVTESATLYRNDGGSFTDVTRSWKLDLPTKLHTGWGLAFIDVDHDGDEDLPMVNGYVVPGRSIFPPHGEDVFIVPKEPVTNPDGFWADYADDNLLLLNNGEGGFLDASHAAGDLCQTRTSARGMIYGDIDNDGDIDLLVTNNAGPARLYRNDAPKSGHWLMVRAIDPQWNRDAIGAEISVSIDDRTLHRILYPYGSYLASNDFRVHFGLGEAASYRELRVRWPDGLVEQFPGGDVDREVRLERGMGTALEASELDGSAAPSADSQ